MVKFTALTATVLLAMAAGTHGSSLRNQLMTDLAVEAERKRGREGNKSVVFLHKGHKSKKNALKFLKSLVSDAEDNAAALLSEAKSLGDCAKDTSIPWTLSRFMKNLGQDAETFFGTQKEARVAFWNCNAEKLVEKRKGMNKKHKAKVMLNGKSLYSPSEKAGHTYHAGVNIGSTAKAKNSYAGSIDLSQPLEVNWVSKGFQTPVKDQGNCNDCYAVSGTDGLSAKCFIDSNQLYDLSAQQYLDCERLVCDPASIQTISEMYGWFGGQKSISNYDQIPLTASQNKNPAGPLDNPPPSCPNAIQNACSGEVQFELHEKVSNAQLMDMVSKQPIQVLVNFPADSSDSYKCGAYTEADSPQNPRSIDHAVLIVGFKWTGNASDSAWIVKNSYGTVYGFNGYFAVSMDGEGAEDPSSYEGSFNGVMSINSNVMFDNSAKISSGDTSLEVKNPENPFADADIFTCE